MEERVHRDLKAEDPVLFSSKSIMEHNAKGKSRSWVTGPGFWAPNRWVPISSSPALKSTFSVSMTPDGMSTDAIVVG